LRSNPVPRATRQLPKALLTVVVRAAAFPARSSTEISVVFFAPEGWEPVVAAPGSEDEAVARPGSMLAASSARCSADRRRSSGTSTWSGSAMNRARSA
jgi:hypothetical protein